MFGQESLSWACLLALLLSVSCGCVSRPLNLRGGHNIKQKLHATSEYLVGGIALWG